MPFKFNPFTSNLDIVNPAGGVAFNEVAVDNGTNPVAGSILTMTSTDVSIVVTGDSSTDTVDLTISLEAIDDRVAALIQDGTGIAWTYDDGANTLTGNVSLATFDTDDLSEGVSNLYHTVARARAAAVADAINDGTLDIAPSQNAVFDALALKVDTTHTNGGASKHDATEVDYERVDGSKKNIQAASDEVEAALTDLDDAIGALAASPTNYTPTDAGITADHLSAIDTELGNKIDKDGSVAFTANQPMGGFKLTGLGAGTSAADSVTKAQLDAVSSIIQNFEWQESVFDVDLTTPPGGPTTGDRYLIGLDTGGSAATGLWATHDGEIAEWDGSAWVFTTPTTGMFVAADDETDRLYLFGGTTWTSKLFEATTASTGLVKSGLDIRLDSSSGGDGLGFSSGVLSVNVDDSTIETNADTLRVKDAGITDAKVAVGSSLAESVTFFDNTDLTGAQAETLSDGSDASSLHNHDSLYVQTVTGDIAHTSFAAANNQAGVANVTGLAFANGTVRSAEIQLSVAIDATADLFESFKLMIIQRGSDWNISAQSTGDNSSIDFTITTLGQVQYTSANESGFVSSTFKFRSSITGV